MRHGQGAQRLLQTGGYPRPDAAMIRIWMPWGGTVGIQTNELIGLQARSLIDGGCMTCMVMYGSGVRTGMGKTIRPILLSIQPGLHRVRSGWAVAAAGATSPGAAGRPFAAGTSLAAATAAWGSGLFFPQVSEQSGARNRTPHPRKALAELALRRRRRFDGARSVRGNFLFNN